MQRNVIFSDSKSALDAVQDMGRTHRNHIVYYVKQAYHDVVRNGKEWVPAHSGIPGNESADLIAKQATTDGYSPEFRVPYEDLLIESKRQAYAQFEEYMKTVSSTKGKKYFNQYHITSRKPWFHKTSFNREEIVLINRLRSDHINLNESLHRVNIVNSPAYPCGDSSQTINHIIFHCEKHYSNVKSLPDYVASKFPNSPQDLSPALSSPTPKLCRLLLAFMKANDLFF
ncbi:hypothetical protein ALC60_07383 [Trachymyrmex zeteki]|uniref:Uncharacterized protein n=1 Tax=Mycetomoellerius zeteki TaxID=64791 RepID=A0A151X014_9HYME|nr:hypothetical protein ALC60_07383 [Trachymyrmex zeteki]